MTRVRIMESTLPQGVTKNPTDHKMSQINPYMHSFQGRKQNPFGRTQIGIAWLWEEVEAKPCTPDQLGNPEIFVFKWDMWKVGGIKIGTPAVWQIISPAPKSWQKIRGVTKKTLRQFWSDRFKTNGTWTQPTRPAFYSFQNDETKIGRVSFFVFV